MGSVLLCGLHFLYYLLSLREIQFILLQRRFLLCELLNEGLDSYAQSFRFVVVQKMGIIRLAL